MHVGTLLPLHEANLANAGKGVKGNLGGVGSIDGDGRNAGNHRCFGSVAQDAALLSNAPNSDETGALESARVGGIASIASVAG
jgi:hypothetical protein